jgi:RimJ/RimL family protein N-acetyltransferase
MSPSNWHDLAGDGRWKDRRVALVFSCMGATHQTSDLGELPLTDSSPLDVRPMTRADRDGLAALFERLSPESRFHRYFSPKPALSRRELDYLSEVGHVGHVAFAAVDRRDGSIVGVARYIEHGSAEPTAELAVEVADEFQRRGIGTALCERVIDGARSNGFTRLTATTLWENQPARGLMRRLGFHAVRSQGREIEFELMLVPRTNLSNLETERRF